MELPFWKHVTWYSEFPILCKHNVMLAKIWKVMFSSYLRFTKLKCFIEENSINVEKIPQVYPPKIYFLTSANVCVIIPQIFQCTIEISQLSHIFLERRTAITQIPRIIFVAFNVSICLFIFNIVTWDVSDI